MRETPSSTPGEAPVDGIIDQLQHGIGQGLGVGGVDQHAMPAVLDDFRRAAHPGGQDRQAQCHRFQDHVGHALAQRRGDQQVGGLHQGGHVRAFAQQQGTLVQFQFADACGQCVVQRAATYQQQPHMRPFRGYAGEGIQQPWQVLVLHQAADDLRGHIHLDGLEAPVGGGACTNYTSGFLPARTLGLGGADTTGIAVDAWNNRIRYIVSSGSSPHFTNATTLRSNGLATRAMTVVYVQPPRSIRYP